MIKGIHAMFYSSQSEQTRDFIKNKLGLPYTDTGDGWLIFDVSEGDIGVHPTEHGGVTGTHDISFYTDDIETTVAQMKGRGVIFEADVADHGYGFVTHFVMPGDVRVQLYQPKYAKRAAKPSKPKKAAAKVKKAVASAKKKLAAKKPKKKSRR